MKEKEIRIFIAVKLSDLVMEQIENLQNELKGKTKEKVKWVNPKNMHVTLKFLGEIPESKLEDVFSAMEIACEGVFQFDIRLQDVGFFPDAKRPRVLWAGIDQEKNELTELAKKIDIELNKFGFAREKRDFKSHLTLARIKYYPKTLITALKGKEFYSDLSLIERVDVIKSDLRRQGPIYTTLKSYEFLK